MFSSLGGERFVRVEHTEALVTVPVRRDLLPGEGGNLLFCWLLTSMRAQRALAVTGMSGTRMLG